MKFMKIHSLYFSPAGSTEKIIDHIAKILSELFNIPVEKHSYTLPEERKKGYHFTEDELVIWGSPVYAGRIPNKTLDYVSHAFSGDGTSSIPVVVYGNRNFDQALYEMTELMRQNGMIPIAGAAIVSRHVFSKILAAGRPDEKDFTDMELFCKKVALLAEDGDLKKFVLKVPGETDKLKYYTPKKVDGTPAKFLKAKPVITRELCTGCGACITSCPMGAMELKDKYPINEKICIKCQACVKHCIRHAIHFEDADLLSHIQMLEDHYTSHKEPQFFYGRVLS